MSSTRNEAPLAPSPIAEQIWDGKYRFKSANGTPVDADIPATWRRIARALAAAEAPEMQDRWAHAFERALSDYKFLPAGRIIAGTGTDRAVTLFNCFVMGRIEDRLEAIFAHLREAAMTLQQGGGIGYDFSTIRPKGAPVNGVGADASGPISFMDVWDSMCETIMSAGARRGAMMATLACDHPDIEDFITAKQTSGRLTRFNLSVLVTDPFMAAVKTDAGWPLQFGGKVVRTVKARALWDKIMAATYAYAEPGVIFIDRINARNNLHYCESIHATNPCGEQPLPPYGACLLGSVNLARLVEHPFTENARIDRDTLSELVGTAVRMLDNAIDVSHFPLTDQEKEAKAKRRIGLGVTGLADALIMCGTTYGSDGALTLIHDWLGTLQRAAYGASIDLAKEKGAFPLFDREAYLAGETIRALQKDLQDRIREHGIRNGLLTSIAPTGTISLFADNVSSGIEPVFSLSYTRRVLNKDGSHRTEEVSDYALRLFRHLKGPEVPVPETFVTAQTLSPDDHLKVQAAAQNYIDSSISKTINLPKDIPFADFKDIYLRAYETGCKGCTTYRPNDVTGAVLSVSEENAVPPASPQADEGGVVYMTEPLDRPDILPGNTYKIRWPDSDHAFYITLNDIMQDGRRRPFEIFINSKNLEHYAWTLALTRMISAVFRRGGDVSFVVEELKAVFDPRGGFWMKGQYVPSLLAAIGDVIERHLREIGFLKSSESLAAVEGPPPAQQNAKQQTGNGRACPRCGQRTFHRAENCDVCGACGFSRCS